MAAKATTHGLTLEPDDAGSGAGENFLLYAGPGVGKTTGAVATAPADRAVLLVNAETANATRYARQMARANGIHVDHVRVTSKDDLRDVMTALRADNGETWGTVVSDPITELYRILVDEACGGNGMPKVQHYGEAGTQLERYARFLCGLPNVTSILVTHEEVTDGPDGPLLMPACGGKKLPGILTAMVDHVGYVGAVTDEQGNTRRVVQFAPGRNRYAKCRGGALSAVEDLAVAVWLDKIKHESKVEG